MNDILEQITMVRKSEKIKKEIANLEQIGSIVSPSSNTQINIALLETARERGIVGALCLIKFRQDGKDTYAIGQVISLYLQNPYLERHSIKKILSVRREVKPLTDQHDVISAQLGIGVVYSIVNEDKIEPDSMRLSLIHI